MKGHIYMYESMETNVSTQEIIPHCEYGDHDLTDGIHVLRCAICERRICPAHTVNNEYAHLGDEVGCPDHKNEIDRLNAERWQHLRAGMQASAPESEREA